MGIRRLSLFTAALLFAVPVIAVDLRIVLPGGSPAAQAQVSVVGRGGSVRADSEGRVTLTPNPQVPFTLVVIGTRGEIYQPLEVSDTSSSLTFRLEPGYVEQVTVTSGAAPNILSSPAAATSVIGRDDLEQRKPEHLVEALDRTAGVTKRGEGPAAVPALRGLASGRTLILIDDGRATAERRAGASATFLNPFILGSVEVARGPGSVAYGSDAFGGVIHARPRDPVASPGSLRYEVSSGAGGSALTSAGLEWSQSLLGGAMLASIYGRSADEANSAGGRAIDNSSYDDRGVTLRFMRGLESSAFRIGLSADRGSDIGAPSADSLVQRTYYPEENSTRLTGSWDAAKVSGFEHVEVRASAARYEIATNRERLPATGVTRQIANATVDANDAALRIAGFRALGNTRLSTGLDFSSRFGLNATGFIQRFNADHTPAARTDELSIDDARKNDAALFVTVDSPLGARLSGSFGLRGDHVSSENSGGFFGDRSRQDSALSGLAALTYAAAHELSASLQASRGYREPTLSDRYFRGISGRGFVTGNPDLDPETSTQFDGSLRWQRHRAGAALYLYHYTIHDLVERYRGGNDFAFRNRGEARIRGAELELTVPLTANVTLHGNTTIARGDALDDSANLDDIPATNGHLAIRWNAGRAYGFVHAFVYAADDRPGPVETDRPAYQTYDIGGGWRFSDRLELRMHARNILDREYAGSADANAALAPGRSITMFLGGVFNR